MSRIKPNHSAPSGPATKLVKTEARVPTGVGIGNSVILYGVAFSNFDGARHYFLFGG